jgi:beta-galactosidase
MTKILRHYFTLFLLIPILTQAQIKVNSIPANQNKSFDKVLFGSSETRNVFLINDGWRVNQENDAQNKFYINIPATFDGDDILIFEKRIELNQQQIDRFEVKLGFLGLNNNAEISINGNIISNHYGGAYPFEISLPKDLLRSDAANKISIKINKKLDSETTIPTKQRFLFPEFEGGIIRDVYIKLVPQLSISRIDFSYTLDQLAYGKINFNVQVENAKTLSGISKQTQFYVHVNIYVPGSETLFAKGDFLQTIYNEDIYDSHFQLDVANPALWSPASPSIYVCEVTLIKDGIVVDRQEREITFYDLKKTRDELFLNGIPFSFSGTTYYPNETFLRKTNLYDKILADLTFIKQTGFNAVRFAKSYPNPYALKVCQQLGLFAFIELPMNSIPEEYLLQNDYQLKVAGFLKEFSSNYYNYSNAILFGIGSGFLPNSRATEKFISKIGGEIKKRNLLTFASFSGWQNQSIENLDFYGFEIFSSPLDDISEQVGMVVQTLGKSSVFFSEVTYPNYKGEASGYLVRNSNEAQAKYFDGVITLSQKAKLSGFFINSLFKYQGSFISLYAGYSIDQFYDFSVLELSKKTNSITYKLLYSRLNNGSKVTIPIGSRKDDNPIIFILIALFLSVVMAILINTKKKFREDATRALLRPYNFFSDIRDNRIISGIHSTLLMLIIAAAVSLLFTILFFYMRNSLLVEKILLSFASRRIMETISFLAWNPQYCFIVLFVVTILKFAMLCIFIKIGSLFVKTRVPISSIYFTVIWAFLPLTLFLPVELVLFKVLAMQTFNSVVLGALVLFYLWLLFRLLKGIYVIFDVRPLVVYLYSFLFVVLLFGGILLKYQLTHSIIYFVGNAFKQYNSMIN